MHTTKLAMATNWGGGGVGYPFVLPIVNYSHKVNFYTGKAQIFEDCQLCRLAGEQHSRSKDLMKPADPE